MLEAWIRCWTPWSHELITDTYTCHNTYIVLHIAMMRVYKTLISNWPHKGCTKINSEISIRVCTHQVYPTSRLTETVRVMFRVRVRVNRNPHKYATAPNIWSDIELTKHPISRPYGRAMGRLLRALCKDWPGNYREKSFPTSAAGGKTKFNPEVLQNISSSASSSLLLMVNNTHMGRIYY